MGVADEDHGGRNAELGEDGAVMSRAAGKLHRRQAEVLGQGGQAPAQTRIQNGGIAVIPLAQLEAHAMALRDLRGQSLGSRGGFAHHLLLEPAEIEDEACLARDLARGGDGRVGVELADGEDEILARRFDRKPMLVQPLQQLDGGGHRVVARLPWGGTGMGIGPETMGMGMAQAAANAGDEADGKPLGLQHRPLLDMDLDEGGDRLPVQMGLAPAQRRHIAARLRQMLRQGPAAVGAADIEGLGIEPAEGGMGSDIGAVEPGGLLGPDRHHRDVPLGRDGLPAQPAEGREPGDHPRGTVIIAALGHRIHMRAGDQPRQLAPLARQGHVEIERRVGPDLEPEPLRRLSRQAMGEVLALAIGGAGDAAADAGMGAQRIEHAARQLDVGLDSRPGGHHRAPSRERQTVRAWSRLSISSRAPMVMRRQWPSP